MDEGNIRVYNILSRCWLLYIYKVLLVLRFRSIGTGTIHAIPNCCASSHGLTKTFARPSLARSKDAFSSAQPSPSWFSIPVTERLAPSKFPRQPSRSPRSTCSQILFDVRGMSRSQPHRSAAPCQIFIWLRCARLKLMTARGLRRTWRPKMSTTRPCQKREPPVPMRLEKRLK